MATLQSLGIDIRINEKPQEVPDAIPFEKDYRHSSMIGILTARG